MAASASRGDFCRPRRNPEGPVTCRHGGAISSGALRQAHTSRTGSSLRAAAGLRTPVTAPVVRTGAMNESRTLRWSTSPTANRRTLNRPVDAAADRMRRSDVVAVFCHAHYDGIVTAAWSERRVMRSPTAVRNVRRSVERRPTGKRPSQAADHRTGDPNSADLFPRRLSALFRTPRSAPLPRASLRLRTLAARSIPATCTHASPR